MTQLSTEDAERMLGAQPFSKLLGTRVIEFRAGFASLGLEVRDDLRQQFGYVHGGVISYLADNALTFAGGSVLGSHVLIAGYSIDFLAPHATDISSRRQSCSTPVHGERAAARRCTPSRGATVS
ncbi:MAG: PaaI family thioesterase, partial [Jiangellaceae bacterium]